MSIFEHIFREESKECAQSFSNSKRRCLPKKRSPEALYDFLGEEEVSCCLTAHCTMWSTKFKNSIL
jgi:hypothetical protein